MATQPPAQPAQPPVRPVILDPWMASVTVLEATSIGSAARPCRVGSATGFFFRNGDNRYLITNRHVVIDEQRRLYPDSLTMRIHVGSRDLAQNRDVAIPLYGADRRPLWLQHPAQADNVDVVAINIGSYVQPQDFITFLSTENFLPSNMILSLGDTVLVLGYPMSFYDTSHNLPIAKTGTMASPYGVPFEGRSYFLIDANLQPGTSGSPVLSPAGSLRRMTDGTNMAIGVDAANHLLGIHSAEHIMEGVELGLHVVWYAGLIQEIVSQEHPRVVQDNNPPQQ